MNNMKKILFPILAAVVTLSSCEQIIDYDLEEGDRKLVVEGLITDQPGPYTVKLSETRGYLDQASNPGITGATVIVSDQFGVMDTLVSVEPGVYQTTDLQGAVGNTYFLRVEHQGKIYVAKSFMQPLNPIDSITYRYEDGADTFDDPGYYAAFYFQEKPGKGDNYRFMFYINGQRQDDITIINDEIYDGNYADADVGITLEQNETLSMEMYSVDKPGYDFWIGFQTLFYQGGSPFDVPPANAPSNISNGAIGYFGASAKRTASKVIQ